MVYKCVPTQTGVLSLRVFQPFSSVEGPVPFAVVGQLSEPEHFLGLSWYGTRRCQYETAFLQPKVIWWGPRGDRSISGPPLVIVIDMAGMGP